ncbi:MAG: sugar transferase [Bacteroidota bacterium]
MSEATYNTIRPSSTSWKPTLLNQNGIIKSFVASKKKYLFLKRCFDILFSTLCILLVLSWLLPIIAALIKLNSKGPVFFKQKRIGLNGKQFICIKFRTMVRNDEADERQAEENDDRITGFGKLLRKTNLDELPQLLNVLIGHMSIVGPRPHMITDCIRFSFVVSSYQFRNLMRPGITGLAQIKGFHGLTADYKSIIIRYYWDAQYVRKAGLWLDIKIICTTIGQSMHNLFHASVHLFKRKNKTLIITGLQPDFKTNKKTI